MAERLDANGAVLTPLDEDGARAVARQIAQLGVPAVAVVFLHAYANPAHEQRMHAILTEEYPGVLVSLSSEVLPQFREFERSMATALNAAVMPPVSRYVGVLREALDAEGVGAPLLIMKSDGGVTGAAACVRQPVQTVLSGPAAGVVGRGERGRPGRPARHHLHRRRRDQRGHLPGARRPAGDHQGRRHRPLSR